VLAILKPRDQDAAGDVNVDFQVRDASYVTVQLSASPRQVPIGLWGEMQWQRGRAYDGEWWLYWTQP